MQRYMSGFSARHMYTVASTPAATDSAPCSAGISRIMKGSVYRSILKSGKRLTVLKGEAEKRNIKLIIVFCFLSCWDLKFESWSPCGYIWPQSADSIEICSSLSTFAMTKDNVQYMIAIHLFNKLSTQKSVCRRKNRDHHSKMRLPYICTVLFLYYKIKSNRCFLYVHIQYTLLFSLNRADLGPQDNFSNMRHI